MKYIECLGSYVPGLIVDRLISDCDNGVRVTMPWRQKYETVCLFCDVSGFTALSEAMAVNGKGAEGLAKHLNSYFSQMLRLIASDGGDVFKFAGDAIIVLWPELQDDAEMVVRRAAQCACAIQENLDKSLMEEGVRLSVKIGIGFGSISVLHIGGVYGRVEYVAVGDPLTQAFNAEGKCTSGQVVCSKAVWDIINEYFTAETVFADGFARINLDVKAKLVRKTSKMNMLRTSISDSDKNLETRIKAYVPGAVSLNPDSPEDEHWGNEVRRCTVLFVNLGLREQHILAASVYDEAMVQVHEVLVETQKAVYQYEGSINKFLVDDKGSTLVACFGLPPVSHDDDAVRGVLASLNLCERLQNLGLVASIGITTGDMFCGVVGSNTRREYTVLGDSVNVAARFMQKVNGDGGGVLCDEPTFLACKGILSFEQMEDVKLKGKTGTTKVYRPYPKFNGSSKGYVHGGLTTIRSNSGNLRNKYQVMHIQQLQNAAVNRALNSIQSYFYERSLISNKQSHAASPRNLPSKSPNPRKQSNVFNFSSAIPSAMDRQNSGMSDDGVGRAQGSPLSLVRRPSLGKESGHVIEDTSSATERSVKGRTKGRRPSLVPMSPADTVDPTKDSKSYQTPFDNLNPTTSANAASAGLVNYMRRGSAIIRSRNNMNSDDTHERDSIVKQNSTELADGMILSRPRSMSESSPETHHHKGSINKPRSLTKISDYSSSDFVTVVVPTKLNMENLSDTSPTLFKNCPLNMFYTFDHLFDHVLDEAVNIGLLPPSTSVHDIALSVAGTRFFIPNSSTYNIRWLALFISAARGRLYDAIPYEVANELALVRLSEVPRVQSRTSLSIRKLLESAINLADHDEGSVIMMEGDAGVGKSEIISSYIAQLQQLSMLIVYSAASAYSDDPLGPFSVVLQQLLDKRAENLKISRTDALRNILKTSADIESDGPLLDKSLGTRLRYVYGGSPRDDSRKLSKFNVGEPLVGRTKSFLEEPTENDHGSDEDEFEEELVSIYNVLEHLTEAEKNARRLRLFFYLFKFLTHQTRTCVIVDDAHFLDEESWALCLLLAMALEGDNSAIEKIVGSDTKSHVLFPNPKLVLLISFRPLLSYRPIFRPPAEIYMLLVESPRVLFLKVEGLPAEEVDQLIVSRLGVNVKGVADELFLLVETKCMGNPWMITELIDTLMKTTPPILVFKELRADDDSRADAISPSIGASSHGKELPKHLKEGRRGSYAISPMGTPEFNLDVSVYLVDNFKYDRCPLPPAVRKAFGARVDRLNSCQITILKTAALIGQQFKWSYLFNCYPVENHKHRLLKEMDRLLMLGFIVELPQEENAPQSGFSSVPGGERTFFFLSAFLVDVLVARMIREHQDAIQTAIFREKNMIEASQRKKFMQKAHLPGTGDILCGMIEVQKKVTTNFFTLRIKRRIQGGDWKPRYCVVRKDRLSMYRDQGHHESSPGTPTQIIFLDGSIAEVEPSSEHNGKPNVFRVDSAHYVRDNTEYFERRSFIFSADSQTDAERWVYMVRYAVELQSTDADKDDETLSSSALALENISTPPPARRKSGLFKSEDSKRRRSYGDKKLIEAIEEAKINASIESARPCSPNAIKSHISAFMSNTVDGQIDAFVCIFVGCAKNLRPMEVYGACNRYVVCTIDKEKRRTEMSSGEANAPFWGKILVIPISMSQWANSRLVVNVWNKEFLLTDDFLGQVRVELKEIKFNDSDEPPNNLGFESVASAPTDCWRPLIVGAKGDTVGRGLTNQSPMTGRALSGGQQGFGFFNDDGSGSAMSRLSPASRMKAEKEEAENSHGKLGLQVIIQPTSRVRKEIHYGPSAGSIQKYLELFRTNEKYVPRRSSAVPGRVASVADIRRSLLVSDSDVSRRPSKQRADSFSKIEPMEAATFASLDAKELQGVRAKKAVKLLGNALRKIDEDAMEVIPAAESGAVNKMWVRQQIRLALENLEETKPEPAIDHFGDHLNKILTNAEELDLDQEHVNWLASQYTRDAPLLPPTTNVIVSDTTSTVDTGTVLTHSSNSDTVSTNILSEVTVSTSRRKSMLSMLEGLSSPGTAAPMPGATRRKSISRRTLLISTGGEKESPMRPVPENYNVRFKSNSDHSPSIVQSSPVSNSSMLYSPAGVNSSGSLSGATGSPPDAPILSSPKGGRYRPSPLHDEVVGDSLISSTPPMSPSRVAPVSIFSSAHSPMNLENEIRRSDDSKTPSPAPAEPQPLPTAQRHDSICDFDEHIEISGEPVLLCSGVPPNKSYFYVDSQRKLVGPFSVEQMMLWDLTGSLNAQVLVYHGSKASAQQALQLTPGVGKPGDRTGTEPCGRFYPLAVFRKTMCYVLDIKINEWPMAIEQALMGVEPNPYSIYSHCLAYRFAPPMQEDLQATSWKFNIWNFAPFELGPLTFLLMAELRMDRAFNLSADRWRCFLNKVQHLMERNCNPYHNFYHVVDVMQTTFMFINKMGARAYLKDIDVLSLMVGALCHDLDHPGLNNPYQINKRTRLAILYNDISVLENYHIATAFEMFANPEYDIFDSLDAVTRKSIRRLVINCVLATDMTVHFQLKGELDSVISSYFPPAQSKAPGDEQVSEVSRSSTELANMLKDKDKDTFLKTLLHLADIGNPTKPWDVSKRWSDLVIQEFFAQGDREKEEGLPVSANMDRATTVQDELSINFNDFIVAPYFMAVTNILPKLHTVCAITLENRDKWHEIFEHRISTSESLEPLAIEEALSKWRKRKVAFDVQIRGVMDAAIEKLSTS